MIAALVAVCSCGNELQPLEIVGSEGRVTLDVSSDSGLLTMAEDGLTGEVAFKSKGGTLALDVLTNQDEWTFETSGEQWLQVTSDDHFLYLEAGRNSEDAAKTATVVVSASNQRQEVSVTLTVSQNFMGGAPEISLGQNALRVKAHTALENSIAIETNQDEWDFDCTCSWLFIEKGDGALILTADPNMTTSQRTAEIIVSAEDDTDRLLVSQDGTAFITLNTHNVTADDKGGVKIIEVTSNPELDWDYETQGDSWFTTTRTETGIEVTIAANADGVERKGGVTINVGESDNSATAALTVRQIGSDTEELIYEIQVLDPSISVKGAPVLTSSTGGSVVVDWGDGSPKETFESRRPVHKYAKAGKYTIEISGTAKSLRFGEDDAESDVLLNVISWGKLGYTSAADMCLGCSALKTIPNDVAGSFAGVKSFLGAFSCCRSLEEIPEGLFKYAQVAKNFEDCFSHSGSISSIPADLFANCTAAEDFSYAFYGTGSGYILTGDDTLPNLSEIKSIVSSGKLRSVPAGLFRNCTSATQMDHVFGATAITEIPEGIFDAVANATKFTGAFSACVNLSKIPVSLMYNAVAALDIKYMFAGCDSLKDIPVGMFKNNEAVTNLEYIFCKTAVESLPAGIFTGLTTVRTIGAAFMDCKSLTDIEAGLFDGLDNARSFRYCFSNCTSLRQVPSGLFRGMINAYEFTYVFENTALESVPADLFADAKDNSSVDFTYAFAECPNLKTVPAGIFDKFTKVSSPGFRSMFEDSGLETVPAGLFKNNVAVSTGFEDMFFNCHSLKKIEGSIFPTSANVTSLSYTFANCTSLTEIPADLFAPLAESKTKFTAAFVGCTSLKSIPEELFRHNVNVTQFTGTFCGCSSLESIPAGLFSTTGKITTVKDLFAECTSLKSIPSGLFAANGALTSFEGTFADCTSLETIPEDLFSAMDGSTSSIKLTECFYGCSSLKEIPSGLFDPIRRINYIDGCFEGCRSLMGESPYTVISVDGVETKVHLYERVKGTDFPYIPSSASAHAGCFAGCTGLTDYNTMPSTWK